MKPETRLRKALVNAVVDMIEVADEIVIQATNYQSEPVDERYAPVVRLLRRAIKRSCAVLAATKTAAQKEGGKT